MILPACYRTTAIAATVLLVGISGCGVPTATPTPVASPAAVEPVQVAEEKSSVENPTTSVVTAEDVTSPESPHPAQPNYRNPFRPPTVKARTVTPEQAESADIRLLGIAKRDSQHIALLETAGEFHKAIVGDFVDQWEVLSVTETETTLRRGLEQMSLRIR